MQGERDGVGSCWVVHKQNPSFSGKVWRVSCRGKEGGVGKMRAARGWGVLAAGAQQWRRDSLDPRDTALPRGV